MRLLNIFTMRIEEYSPEAVPSYAILSHRWGEEEVSLQEWNRIGEIEAKLQTISTHRVFKAARHENDYYHESLNDQYNELLVEQSTIKAKKGYWKITSSCAEVNRSQKFLPCSHIWIDTCCIDKTNNAELSEAINSMFKWYRNAFACLVFLADVPATDEKGAKFRESIRSSDWFERGWTLQELLAPERVYFYNQEWERLFERSEKATLIAQITRIEVGILKGYETLSEACTAKKMSWAATRKTTRKEDQAYCLLGLFNVSMPLLYGEGDKAFVRLQEEIIRQSGDLSIFAWGYQSFTMNDTPGMFAHSPADFIGCWNFGSEPLPAVISVTNITLDVTLSYCRPDTDQSKFVYGNLNCFVRRTYGSIFLPLVKLSSRDGQTSHTTRYRRAAGVRPILVIYKRPPFNNTPHFPFKGWIWETATLSIRKFEPYSELSSLPDAAEIVLTGLNPSTFIVDEIYPPHVWGTTAEILNFGATEESHLGSPFNTQEPREGSGESTAYLKISHRRRREHMVIIIRRLDTSVMDRSRWDFVVALADWPDSQAMSLAQLELNFNEGKGKGIDAISGLKVDVNGRQFEDFFVQYLRDRITISTYEDAAESQC